METLLEAARGEHEVRMLTCPPGRCYERKGRIVGGSEGVVFLSDRPEWAIRWTEIIKVEIVEAA